MYKIVATCVFKVIVMCVVTRNWTVFWCAELNPELTLSRRVMNVTRSVEPWCRCRGRLICNMGWSRSEFSIRHAEHKNDRVFRMFVVTSGTGSGQAVFTYVIEFNWSRVLHKQHDCQISFGLHKSFHLLIVLDNGLTKANSRRLATRGSSSSLPSRIASQRYSRTET